MFFFFNSSIYFYIIFLAQVAQLVEQATENHKSVVQSSWAPHEKSIHTNLYPTVIHNRQQIRLYLFSHEQGLHWNYKIVFKSDYTGIEEKRDYQLQMHHYLLIKKESLFQTAIQMET